MACQDNSNSSALDEWTSMASDTQHSFKSQTNYEGYVLQMMKYLASHPFQNREWMVGNSPNKSCIESEKLRNEGNKIYTSKPLDSSKCLLALKFYSTSILIAPDDSEEIAIAYANKSSVLYTLGKYKESIQDISRTLELNYPHRLDKMKLYRRAMACLEKLFPRNMTHKLATEKLKELNVPETMINEWRMKNIHLDDLSQASPMPVKEMKIEDEFPIPKIESPNNELPGASDAIGVKQNTRYGRYLVSTRNIQPGETLVVEKVYSFLVDMECVFATCYHCLRSSFASIPCEFCQFAMYCSEECKIKDWSMSHDVECQIFRFFPVNEARELLQITRMTVQTLRKFSTFKRWKYALDHKDDDEYFKECPKEEKLQIKSYQMIDSLETHLDKISMSMLWSDTKVVCHLLQAIAKHTSIFGHPIMRISAMLKNNNVLFFGGLLLKSIFTCSINTYGINGWISTCMESTTVSIASGLSPCVCLSAHDCDPNVTIFWRSDTLVMHAVYPIQKGNMITMSYCPPYYKIPKMLRSIQLLKYFFICNCTACKKNWPVYNDSTPQVHRIRREKIQRKIKTAIRKCLSEINTIRPKKSNFQHLLDTILLIDDYLPRNSFEMITATMLLRSYYGQLGNRHTLMINQA